MSVPSVGSLQKSFPVAVQDSVSSQIVLTKPNIEQIAALTSNQVKKAKLALEEEQPKNEADSEREIREKTLKAQGKAIDAYFRARGMPLKGTGRKMAEEAEKNGLDYRLLPAIAVVESTGGKHACKRVANSFFGWGSCKISFESKDKAIEIVARNLGGNNPNTAHHYDGKTTKQILQKYNPPSIVPKYAGNVMRVMNSIGDAEIILEAPVIARAS
ncbi:MAG: hypothetical protein ABIR14_02190 [Candidatus Paceibacterota bacterium]